MARVVDGSGKAGITIKYPLTFTLGLQLLLFNRLGGKRRLSA